MTESVTLSLGQDEALILLELLADFHREQALVIRENAARLALMRLGGVLEKTLVEVFMPNYGQIISDARERLVAAWGE